MSAIAISFHSPPSPHADHKRGRDARGFSLIEAAIVLAVVGAVIGTIWWAAAAVSENWKVNKTVEDLLLTVRNIQGFISFRDAEAIDGGNIVVITSTLRDADVFPKDWVSGNTVTDPFGKSVAVRSYYSSMFMISFNAPRQICSNLLVKISSLGVVHSGGWGALGLKAIQVNYPDWGTTTFPVSAQQAETACTDVTNNRIYFYFPYTRQN